LTLWYAAIFTLSSLAAFVTVYFVTASIIKESTDEDLQEDVIELGELRNEKGMEAVLEEIRLEVDADGSDMIFFRIFTPYGKVLFSTYISSWQGIEKNEYALKRLSIGSSQILNTLTIPGHPHRIRTVYGTMGSGEILQIGQSLEEDEEFMAVFRDIFGITLAVLMVSATLIGWFMARRALMGVEEVTGIATAISNGALDKRVPLKSRGAEIDKLAATFNLMLDRIHSLITGIREMTDNIAHDLRHPITRIRGIAEMTLTAETSMNEYETMAANTIEECDRLLGMINTMLDITEAETGARKLSMTEIDMASVLRDACELFQPISEDKGVTIIPRLPARSVMKGDIQRLQRMIANLLDNALKYTGSGGEVMVSLDEDEKEIIITVADSGLGMSEDDLPHIFKRFYRCDQSRSQSGNGLGLSLAQAIAKTHGGNIRAASVPGKGSAFTVTLPRLSA
jgi:signal transduction histidine kinase